MSASVLAVAIIALAPATPEKFPTRLAPAPSSGDNERTPADAAPYASRLGARLPRAGALRREQVLAAASGASQCLPRACPTPHTAERRISERWRNQEPTGPELPQIFRDGRSRFPRPPPADRLRQMTQARALPHPAAGFPAPIAWGFVATVTLAACLPLRMAPSCDQPRGSCLARARMPDSDRITSGRRCPTSSRQLTLYPRLAAFKIQLSP